MPPLSVHMSRNPTWRLLRAHFLMIALAACSSGSGDTGGVPLTGRFLDGPVAGLQFQTNTLAGETNANGEFRYRAGEMVRFSVGDILLGQTVGAATLSPFDLAGGAPPLTGADIRLAVHRVDNLKQPTSLEI